jgi:hypothetical protein
MRTLNDPIVIEPAKPAEEWTAACGLRRAALWGTVAAIAVALAVAPLAYYAPTVILNLYVRAAMTFAIALIMFSVVQRCAGMVGLAPSALAVGFTLAILYSNHVVFAWHGVVLRDGATSGSIWLHPMLFLTLNVPALVVLVITTVLCHNGGGGLHLLLSVCNVRLRGS